MGPEEAFRPGTEGLRDGEVDGRGWAEEAGSGVGVFEVGRWAANASRTMADAVGDDRQEIAQKPAERSL